ncbi:MAG: RagB/SusD family nutrient uptake outer membrane protein [Prevotella sp.]|nr:RagB/SusD family nutrient uptake outer membrane protein [Prevotella sp.]
MVKFILPLYLFTLLPFLTSCEDFFNQESDYVVYDEVEHLNSAVDSMYSVTGIMNKLQELADRTVLLGEVRGDLVDLTTDASSDLRDVANFNVGDDNMYNRPRDYYAVINNCNYFLAHADTALKNNRNEYIFMREYAAVKAFRAWTYLQLVLNYGQVPFVTEPILSKSQAEQAYPMYTIQDVCQYFINDLAAIPERYNTETPSYRTINGLDSKMFYFPLSIVRGDLYLWLATTTQSKEAYRQAALNYYKYISERNGQNSAYYTDLEYIMWSPGSSTWNSITMRSSAPFSSESFSSDNELITLIPGTNNRAEGNYSELRNLFNSREENDYKVSLVPSQAIQDISAAQVNCCLNTSGTSVTYAPLGLSNHRTGDLRLYNVWSDNIYRRDRFTGELIEMQSVEKYSTRNVHIYRRMMVYLRMAEALNQAGYPRMAFLILSSGVNNDVIQQEIIPYYPAESDSTYLAQFDFPVSRYILLTAEGAATGQLGRSNTMGVHSRGSGWTPLNEYYVLPNDTLEPDQNKLAQLVSEQQVVVDSLLLNEDALEFAFEGTRYYDLMRFAMRQNNPGAFLSKYIYARRGADRAAEVQAEVKASLSDQRNWFLRWNGQIGLLAE